MLKITYFPGTAELLHGGELGKFWRVIITYIVQAHSSSLKAWPSTQNRWKHAVCSLLNEGSSFGTQNLPTGCAQGHWQKATFTGVCLCFSLFSLFPTLSGNHADQPPSAPRLWDSCWNICIFKVLSRQANDYCPRVTFLIMILLTCTRRGGFKKLSCW